MTDTLKKKLPKKKSILYNKAGGNNLIEYKSDDINIMPLIKNTEVVGQDDKLYDYYNTLRKELDKVLSKYDRLEKYIYNLGTKFNNDTTDSWKSIDNLREMIDKAQK